MGLVPPSLPPKKPIPYEDCIGCGSSEFDNSGKCVYCDRKAKEVK